MENIKKLLYSSFFLSQSYASRVLGYATYNSFYKVWLLDAIFSKSAWRKYIDYIKKKNLDYILKVICIYSNTLHLHM